MGVNSETLRIFGTSTTGGKDELKTPNQSTSRHRKLEISVCRADITWRAD